MNRKGILISFGVTCLAILAGYGVSKTVSNDTDLEVLTLHNIEALAEGEDAWGFWDGVGNSLKLQGWTKDEYPLEKECTEEISFGFYSISWKGKRIICKDGGNQNCSTVWCEE